MWLDNEWRPLTSVAWWMVLKYFECWSLVYWYLLNSLQRGWSRNPSSASRNSARQATFGEMFSAGCWKRGTNAESYGVYQMRNKLAIWKMRETTLNFTLNFKPLDLSKGTLLSHKPIFNNLNPIDHTIEIRSLSRKGSKITRNPAVLNRSNLRAPHLAS